MAQIILIGLAAGAASALLFASVASGSLLAVPLFNLAPLPILIVAIGWNHLAGLLAATIAATLLAVVFGGLLFLNFLIGVGLPAWWLSYLVMLARPTAGAPGGLEWYPLGRIVIWAALVAALVVTLVIFMIATDAETLRASLGKLVEAFREATPAESERTPSGLAGWLARVLIDHPDRVLLPAAAVLITLMQVFTLWLSARIVNVSGRLRRPWPQISAMTFPPGAPLLVVAAFAGTMLPGLIGIVASVILASLLTAYALLGLAVLHALTRRVNGRGFILGSVYAAIVLFGWPLLALAVLGLADAAVDLRGRNPAGGPPAADT